MTAIHDEHQVFRHTSTAPSKEVRARLLHLDKPTPPSDRDKEYTVLPTISQSPLSSFLHRDHATRHTTMSLHQNGGSSTCVVEPIELQSISHHLAKPQDAKTTGLRLSDTRGSIEDDDSPTDLPSPITHPAVQAEQWNHPRSNLFKCMAAFWSFVVMGSNDAAYGALIPYVSLVPTRSRD